MEDNKKNDPKIYVAPGDEDIFNDFFETYDQNSVKESYVCENVGEPQPKSKRNDILNTNLPTMQSTKKSPKFDMNGIMWKLRWLAWVGFLVGNVFVLAGSIVAILRGQNSFWGMTVVGNSVLLGVIIWMYDKNHKRRFVGFILCLLLGLMIIIFGGILIWLAGVSIDLLILVPILLVGIWLILCAVYMMVRRTDAFKNLHDEA